MTRHGIFSDSLLAVESVRACSVASWARAIVEIRSCCISRLLILGLHTKVFSFPLYLE